MTHEDYSADLKHLSGISQDDIIKPVLAEKDSILHFEPDSYSGVVSNNDIAIAGLNLEKAALAVKASNYSYIPDVGITGGYTYQDGNVLYPANNVYAGASIKWNIQDLVSNSALNRQRNLLKRQAEANLEETKEQVSIDINKATRKIKQAYELLSVARKALNYRKEELRIQTDRLKAGLSLEAEFLSARASKAKAESDYFAALMGFKLAKTELAILTGTY